jgi:hypothetical protein
MNTLTHKTLSALAIAGLLLGANGTAIAGETGQRAPTGVGHAIAAQGNAALEQIRMDLRQRIEQTLQPLTAVPTGFRPQGVADAPGTDPTERAA